MSSSGFPECAAVIVGGGSGSRFGGDKLSLPLAGLPVLVWSLLAFEQTPSISSIVLVAPEGRMDEFRSMALIAGISKLDRIVEGGLHRYESVLTGLLAVAPSAEFVAIHDAARPLVTPALIGRCLAMALESGASAAAAPVCETLHQADQQGCAVRTVDRTGLWAMQTPQVFRPGPLGKLLSGHSVGKPTDEVSVALSAGWRIPLVENHEPNIKITWPADLKIAEALLLSRRSGS